MASFTSQETVSSNGIYDCIFDEEIYGLDAPEFECFKVTPATSTLGFNSSTTPFRSWCLTDTEVTLSFQEITYCYDPLKALVGIELVIATFIFLVWFMVRLFRKT